MAYGCCSFRPDCCHPGRAIVLAVERCQPCRSGLPRLRRNGFRSGSGLSRACRKLFTPWSSPCRHVEHSSSLKELKSGQEAHAAPDVPDRLGPARRLAQPTLLEACSVPAGLRNTPICYVECGILLDSPSLPDPEERDRAGLLPTTAVDRNPSTPLRTQEKKSHRTESSLNEAVHLEAKPRPPRWLEQVQGAIESAPRFLHNDANSRTVLNRTPHSELR